MPFSAWLLTLPQWLSALLVVGFFVMFGVSMVLVVRRLIDHTVLKLHNDISGFVFANLGVIYGVMLAFVVIDVWEDYRDAEAITQQESTEAFALYSDLNLYPNQTEADKALAALRVYSLSVVRDEFPAIKAMNWDSRFQPRLSTHEASNQLWAAIKQIVPRNLHEQSLYAEILKDMNSMAQLSVKRRVIAQNDLPGVLWAVVVLGGLVTVGFTALFGHESLRGHIVLAGLLSFVVGGVIYVVVSLNYPFMGEICIHPDGYEYLIEEAGWGGS